MGLEVQGIFRGMPSWGASVGSLGLTGILYYNYDKEPPK